MQTNISIDKLLQNDDFISWTIGNSNSQFKNWDDEIANATAEEKKIYQEATIILNNLLKLDVESNIEQKSDDFIDESYSKLINQYNKTSNETKVINIKPLLKYAAILIVSISIAALAYTSQKSSDIFEKHLIASNFNPNKVQIKTQEGKFYNIDSDKKHSWLTDNGLFISVDGDELLVKKADSFKDSENNKYTVLVPRGKKYQIALEDGTDVELNSYSQLTFNISNSDFRKVSLKGEAYFDVAKNKKKPFIVHTKRMDIQVLGTEFNVSTYETQKYYSTTLVEGSIKITTANGEKKTLSPSDQARVYNNSSDIKIIKADVQSVVSWTSGRMVFRNEPLDALTARLSRWFNIEFKINEEIKDIKFNGTITKEKNLLHILQMLEYTEGLSYEVKKDTIKLYRD